MDFLNKSSTARATLSVLLVGWITVAIYFYNSDWRLNGLIIVTGIMMILLTFFIGFGVGCEFIKFQINNPREAVGMSCTCPKECDCENPPPEDWDGKNGVFHVSNWCPVHNLSPDPADDCPLHGT